MKLANYSHLGVRLRMCAALPPLPIYLPDGLCTGITSYFTYSFICYRRYKAILNLDTACMAIFIFEEHCHKKLCF
jgi:hypothetical protein